MEKAVGILCEYNPLHRGHAAQIAAVRRRFPEKPVVLLLSGTYVQRGEAAVCDPYARAAAALACGADLVLMLPFPYSAFGARGYAESAIRVFARLGAVDTVAFGACTQDEALLAACADALESPAFEARLSAALAEDARASFAHLRAEVLEEFCPGGRDVLREPNDILALEYLAAIRRGGYDLTPAVFPREGAYSAARVRETLEKGSDLWEGDVPEAAREILKSAIPSVLPQKKLGEALLCALRAGMKCPELSELGARIGDAARGAENFEDFLDRAKTRKITRARIRRGVLHAFFGVTEAGYPPVSYTVLLAANDLGRRVLSFIYNIGDLPVYTKPSAPQKEGAPGAEVSARAASVYAGLIGGAGDLLLKKNPIIVNKL